MHGVRIRYFKVLNIAMFKFLVSDRVENFCLVMVRSGVQISPHAVIVKEIF